MMRGSRWRTTKDTDGVEEKRGGAVVSDNTISATSRPGLELNDSRAGTWASAVIGRESLESTMQAVA